VLGSAYLRLGRLAEASLLFDKVVRQTRTALAKINEQKLRDGSLKRTEASYRGQIFLKLVHGNDAKAAFALWQGFRADRAGKPSLAAEAFPDGVSLLAVVSLPSGVAVFAVDQSAVEAKWIPAGSLALDDSARAFAALCSSPENPESEIDRVGRTIYDAVILPFEARLLGKRVLAISAEGAMASVPWSALRDRQGRRLIERQTVALVGQLSPEMPEIKTTSSAVRRPLVVAAPALAAELAMAYPPLGNSIGEANEISHRFPGTQVLTGSQATVKTLKELLPQSAFFHFGGHGNANGGYGAILLAPSGQSDGVFDAAEIGRLDLRGVRVVSLASCSSGAGEMTGPVNPDSLVRALLDAGVRNVIAAPWRVDSGATNNLFGDFYGRLAASGRAADSLRQACLHVSRRPGLNHPYFWAGFQTYGAPDL
jgi:CHAT domain-containing protein